MKIYISGPMTGIEDLNFPAFHFAEKVLKSVAQQFSTHIEVENPASWGLPAEPYEDCIKFAITKLMDNCKYVIALEGWENSKGANAEIAVAIALGIPVLSLEDVTSIFGEKNEQTTNESI